MIYFIALLSGLLAGAATGFGVGFAAAELFTRIGGSREGANAMGGFFFIGPFGLVAGFLAVFGAVVRYGGGHAGLAKWSIISGGCVLGLGGLVVLLALADFNRGNGQVADYNLEYEFEVPASVDSSLLRHRYVGEAPEEGPVAEPFYDVREAENAPTIAASASQMVDNPSRRYVVLALEGGWRQRFDIPYPGSVREARGWTEWTPGEHGVRFRWQMRKAR